MASTTRTVELSPPPNVASAQTRAEAREAAERQKKAARRRRSGRLQTLFATALIVAGLAVGGSWAWNTFGTTMVMQEQMVEDIESFAAQIPEAPATLADVSALHTDFELFPPPVLDIDALELGEPFGVLTVPSWQGRRGVHGTSGQVAVGDGEILRNRILVKQGGATEAETNKVLDTGAAAHYSGTAGPGDIGNFSLSAHRRSRGDNFLYLPDLAVDDWILLETADTWYIYRVIGSEIVLPDEMHVVQPDPFSPMDENGEQFPTRRLITLTTCTLPNGSAFGNSHRYIVHGELYGWMDRADGIPPMIDNYWDEDLSPLNA